MRIQIANVESHNDPKRNVIFYNDEDRPRIIASFDEKTWGHISTDSLRKSAEEALGEASCISPDNFPAQDDRIPAENLLAYRGRNESLVAHLFARATEDILKPAQFSSDEFFKSVRIKMMEILEGRSGNEIKPEAN